MNANTWGTRILLLLLLCALSGTRAQHYTWPLYPVLDQYVSGVFCEYRSTNHFHEGIDIPASGGGYYVYATTDTFKYIGSFPYLAGYGLIVQHYTEYNNAQMILDEGSRYIHVTAYNQNLTEGQVYVGEPLAENIQLDDNHLHFEMREPAPIIDDEKNARNPFKNENLSPVDEDVPYVDFLFVDGDPGHYGNATINEWNFLGYDFNSYYNDGIAIPYVQLLLPPESRDNDLDDPHFLISDNCQVRFTLQAKDRITPEPGTSNCGLYWISLYTDTCLAAGPEESPYLIGSMPYYEVKFEILDNTFYDETHDEEDVFHTEPPLQSTNSTFYYRLYPTDANNSGHIPDCVITKSIVLRTEDLDEGHHRIRVVVEDKEGNVKTGDAHLYKRMQDWIDYSRGFSAQ